MYNQWTKRMSIEPAALVTLVVLWMLVGGYGAFEVSTARAQQPIKTEIAPLGVVSSLSGSGMIWGLSHQRAIRLWVNEVSERGGIPVGGTMIKFNLIPYDSLSTPAGAMESFHKLIFRDHAKIILGPVFTSEALAVKDLANENKILTFNASINPIPRRPEYPYTFVVFHGAYGKNCGVLGYLRKVHPQASTIACIAPNDESGRSDLVITKEMAPKYGIRIVLEDYYERGTTDFYPILQRAISKNPGCILLSSVPSSDCFNMCKQARELGYSGLMGTSGAGLDAEACYKVAGKYSEGFFFNSLPSGKFAAPGYSKFEEKYRKTFDGSYDSSSGNYYAMCQVIEQAIRRANSIDTTKLANVIEGGKDFDTIIGKIYFGGKELYGRASQMAYDIGIGVVRNGHENCEALIPIEYK